LFVSLPPARSRFSLVDFLSGRFTRPRAGSGRLFFIHRRSRSSICLSHVGFWTGNTPLLRWPPVFLAKDFPSCASGFSFTCVRAHCQSWFPARGSSNPPEARQLSSAARWASTKTVPRLLFQLCTQGPLQEPIFPTADYIFAPGGTEADFLLARSSRQNTAPGWILLIARSLSSSKIFPAPSFVER
jgi:hypothetical protein